MNSGADAVGEGLCWGADSHPLRRGGRAGLVSLPSLEEGLAWDAAPQGVGEGRGDAGSPPPIVGEGAGWGPWGKGGPGRRRRPRWQSSRPGSARWRPLPRRSLPVPVPPAVPPSPAAAAAAAAAAPAPAPPPHSGARSRQRPRPAAAAAAPSAAIRHPKLSSARASRGLGGGGAGAARGRHAAAPGAGPSSAVARPGLGDGRPEESSEWRRRHKLRCSWRALLRTLLLPRSTSQPSCHWSLLGASHIFFCMIPTS
ncbi:translation initiation factor IF-2-like [Camelus ferus]|uniref:Translation initiation factor IF-2-like n=1 Tax=Camelus ferus TaxID=419612 RepID=A0A8B8SNU4_CAMFR|nr:translation initiation factor IF-2-like [Camelus ferus]